MYDKSDQSCATLLYFMTLLNISRQRQHPNLMKQKRNSPFVSYLLVYSACLVTSVLVSSAATVGSQQERYSVCGDGCYNTQCVLESMTSTFHPLVPHLGFDPIISWYKFSRCFFLTQSLLLFQHVYVFLQMEKNKVRDNLSIKYHF